MLRFKVTEELENNKWVLYCIDDLELRIEFPIAYESLAHDICDFLNDKYFDKNINEEWKEIDRKDRIRYLLQQAFILSNDDRISWNRHGNGVE